MALSPRVWSVAIGFLLTLLHPSLLSAKEDPAYPFTALDKDLAQARYASIERHFKVFLKGAYLDGANYAGLAQYYARLEKWDNASALKQWALADPKASIPLIALGSAYIDKGWEYRGGSTKVTKENAKIFQNYLEKATFFLKTAEALNPPDPYLYNCLLVIGRTQCWPGYIERKLFKKGLEISPSNYDLLNSMLLYYSPMWCGNDDTILNFKDEYLIPAPQDSDVRLLIPEVYTQIWYNRNMSNDYFKKDPKIWKVVRPEFENYLSRHPANLSVHSWYCSLALLSEDYREAKRQFDALGDHWDANPRFFVDKGKYLKFKEMTDKMVARLDKAQKKE